MVVEIFLETTLFLMVLVEIVVEIVVEILAHDNSIQKFFWGWSNLSHCREYG